MLKFQRKTIYPSEDPECVDMSGGKSRDERTFQIEQVSAKFSQDFKKCSNFPFNHLSILPLKCGVCFGS